MNESIRHPDGSLTLIVDNGDGTGTRTEIDAYGERLSTVPLSDLPVPAPEPQPVTEARAAIEAGRAVIAPLSSGSVTKKALEPVLDALEGLVDALM